MNTDWVGFAAVIGAVGAFVTALGAIILGIYNQRAAQKEKRIDFEQKILEKKLDRELEQRDKEVERRISMIEMHENDVRRELQTALSHALAHIYGYLWELRSQVGADRISIIQPHPSNNRQFISVSHEIIDPRSGVAKLKHEFQFKPYSEWGDVISQWASREYIVYRSLSDIRDVKLYAEAYRRGIKGMVFYRLTSNSNNSTNSNNSINSTNYWLGTVMIDFVHNELKNIDFVKSEINKVGALIADVLPEYSPAT
jgi:hypothetical protein